MGWHPSCVLTRLARQGFIFMDLLEDGTIGGTKRFKQGLSWVTLRSRRAAQARGTSEILVLEDGGNGGCWFDLRL